jgi:hypothetical protein
MPEIPPSLKPKRSLINSIALAIVKSFPELPLYPIAWISPFLRAIRYFRSLSDRATKKHVSSNNDSLSAQLHAVALLVAGICLFSAATFTVIHLVFLSSIPLITLTCITSIGLGARQLAEFLSRIKAFQKISTSTSLKEKKQRIRRLMARSAIQFLSLSFSLLLILNLVGVLALTIPITLSISSGLCLLFVAYKVSAFYHKKTDGKPFSERHNTLRTRVSPSFADRPLPRVSQWEEPSPPPEATKSFSEKTDHETNPQRPSPP